MEVEGVHVVSRGLVVVERRVRQPRRVLGTAVLTELPEPAAEVLSLINISNPTKPLTPPFPSSSLKKKKRQRIRRC
ncbi:hypothetical protein, partial [Streptomyces scabiei]|uniref:hypothetical protein n=1 Tax=Streptomyces scabiei TaxID=1930 RepID=UPI0029AFADFD